MKTKPPDSRRLTIAGITGVLGVSLGLSAVAMGGIGLALLWPAASLGLVSAGYIFLGPLVCGKMQSGQRTGWATALHLPCLSVIHVTWKIGRFIKPDAPWNEVAPGLFIGRKLDEPGALPPGTKMVVDMTAEYTEPRCIVEATKYRCIPTLDGTAKTSDNYAQVLAEATRESEPVYVHCAVGYGRSAMFAASVMIARGHSPDVETAEQILQRHRPHVKLQPSHKQAIQRFCSL